MIEVRFHGRGGQGAVTAAELLARAAIAEGKYAQGFPNFGPERRGAPVTAFLRVSDDPILLREKIYSPDVVVVLDASLIGLVDVCEGMKPGGTLLVNTPETDSDRLAALGKDLRIAVVDAGRIALETLGVPITNTAIIGALVRATGLTKTESLDGPMQNRFGRLAEKNLAALARAHGETKILREPENASGDASDTDNPASPAGDNSAEDYEAFLKNEALLPWQQVQTGCDIDRPGSSAEFFTGNWRTTGLPVVEKEKCVKCGLCWILCPENAWVKDAEGTYDLDPRYCKGCGVCAEECLKGIIEMKEEK